MGTAKNIIVGTGVVLIWVGGFVLAWKAGGLIGEVVGKGCSSATNILIKKSGAKF